ncbi:MAG: SDR family oxidoreductase [Gammaproteobacteria bacterium]|nr:SDR family oxidoreductase [Gammaproteobacteria bacterium]
MGKLFRIATLITLLLTGGSLQAALDAGAPTVLITGSNRGIGLEFVRQFAERGWNVIATARKPDQAEDLQALAAQHDTIVIEQLDVTDHPQMEALAERYADQPIDILLSNAALTPRYKSAFKRVDGVDFDTARQSFEINALGALKLAQVFMPHVAASEQKKIIVLTSKGGSFEMSPKLPMMYSYRASKAALNMFMYTLSFETAKKEITVTMLSPGMVNTTPGFNNPQGISPEESVSKMLTVVDGLTLENNGQFLNYESGEVVPW